MLFKLQTRVSGQLRPGLGGAEGDRDQERVRASLPQLSVGGRRVVLSQQLLAGVRKNKGVKVLSHLSLYFFFFLGVTPAVYGGSQAGGRIGAASLHHSHSNTRSKPLL